MSFSLGNRNENDLIKPICKKTIKVGNTEFTYNTSFFATTAWPIEHPFGDSPKSCLHLYPIEFTFREGFF